MFKYFNQFMTADPNGLDVLIMDEAHRIRKASVDRYTRTALRTDRPQIDELIAAARVPVFLLDEHQVVRPGEMGTLRQIEQHARHLGLELNHIDLGEAAVEQLALALDPYPRGPGADAAEAALPADPDDTPQSHFAALARRGRPG